jgi:copper chaperone CopZ
MDQSGALQALEIPVSGMHCDRCVQRVRAALGEVPGIQSAHVSLGKVVLEYYPEAISLDAVRAKIEALGYAVPVATRSGNPVRRFLDRMSVANEKAFGNEPLDCCTMKKYVK